MRLRPMEIVGPLLLMAILTGLLLLLVVASLPRS